MISGGRHPGVREATRAELARRPVAVLFGGSSSEREVSLWTGAGVARALAEAPQGAEPPGPARVHAVELTPDGGWILDGTALRPLEVLAELGPRCVYFLALHGGTGEDGTLQGLLAAQGCVHTGSGVGASALCLDKHATRLVLREAGVPVAPGLRIEAAEWTRRRSELVQRCRALPPGGWSVKPSRGGSSVATFLFDTAAELEPAIERVLATGDHAIVEQRIRGAEATCAVLGNRGGPIEALTPVEIVPKQGRFFDFEEKYSAGGAQEFCPPRTLAAATVARLAEQAVRAYRAADCDGYARIDFMIPRGADGAEGEPLALEINTLPGLTARSLLPQAAAVAGFSYRALCLEVLALALERAP